MLFSNAFSKSPEDFTYSSEPTIPKSILGYGTNTQYNNFPPKMTDGRSLMSSWQPESAANDQIIKSNGITSNWEYRKYLTNNGYNIMESNFTDACNDTGYASRPESIKTPMENQIFDSIHDNKHPFGYHDSDLKQLYLSREQLQSRKVSPVITQEQLLNMNMR